MRRIWIVLVVVLTVLAGGAGRLSARAWTSSDGKYTVEAELVAHDEKTVTLKKSDGSTVSVPLARLSQADREHLVRLRRIKPMDLSKTIVGTWVGRIELDEEILRRFMIDKGYDQEKQEETRNHLAAYFAKFRIEVTYHAAGTYSLVGVVRNREVPEEGSWRLTTVEGEHPELTMKASGSATEVKSIVMRGPDEFLEIPSEDDVPMPVKRFVYRRYDKERAEAERARLAGSWIAVTVLKTGAKLREEAGTRYTFRENRVSIDGGDGFLTGEYLCYVDAKHEPAKIHLIAEGGDPGIVLTGIWRLEDNDLTLCLTPGGRPYPRGFQANERDAITKIFNCRREARNPNDRR